MGLIESLVMMPSLLEVLELVLIGLVLSVDSFATAAALGVCADGLDLRQTLRLCGGFALSHIVMIMVGFFLGFTVIIFIEGIDHWVAFGLLMFVGVKFVYDGMKDEPQSCEKSDPTRGLMLVSLCVATSLDALAMGGAFAAMHVGVLIAAFIVAVCVAVISYIGSEAHHFVSARFGRYASVVGGVVLMALGFKVLFDHLVW